MATDIPASEWDNRVDKKEEEDKFAFFFNQERADVLRGEVSVKIDHLVRYNMQQLRNNGTTILDPSTMRRVIHRRVALTKNPYILKTKPRKLKEAVKEGIAYYFSNWQNDSVVPNVRAVQYEKGNLETENALRTWIHEVQNMNEEERKAAIEARRRAAEEKPMKNKIKDAPPGEASVTEVIGGEWE